MAFVKMNSPPTRILTFDESVDLIDVTTTNAIIGEPSSLCDKKWFERELNNSEFQENTLENSSHQLSQ